MSSRHSREPARSSGPPGTLEAGVRKAVEDAARQVLEDESAWRWHALKPDEAAHTMGRLVAVVTGETDGDRADCGAVIALAMRLSDLLRQELLDNPRGLSNRALLDVVRRIEACRARLEPRARQDLAYLLTGANALELVVEFAHDLRSPLTSIMFLAETLRRGRSGEINDIQREQLGIMYSAALAMVNVANDLMDLASSEVDGDWADSTVETFSIAEVVEETRKVVAPMVEQKRLDLSYHTPQHDTRVGHPVLIGRVLLNLVTNAIKFTEQGRVEIVAEESPGSLVTFSVQDTGRGMSDEALESVRGLFGRSESRTGYHFSESGLGLAICQRMVEKMGGTLNVESREGEGTRFHFELDLPRP